MNFLDLPYDVLYIIDVQVQERKQEYENIFKDLDELS